ncbi:MAG: molybdopterin-binding protein [Negativicutes bacterium]|nr:molybdopterin-binding protein [Negativicutes bacterium]
MEKVVIIPTGDEILQGIVLDTNSPALMGIILEKFPSARVERATPVPDDPEAIKTALKQHSDYDLIIFIGGSGGGKCHDPDLAEDMTHPTLGALLSPKLEKKIYGYNGHLWSCLMVGRWNGKALVANVPGPYVEAVAAGKALIAAIAKGRELEETSERIAQAVLAQYPSGSGLRYI